MAAKIQEALKMSKTTLVVSKSSRTHVNLHPVRTTIAAEHPAFEFPNLSARLAFQLAP
jgi:hypothetical protein